MNKRLACILVAMMMTAMPLAAYADGTTTLTTTVPAATYTLHIPADQVIDFGTTEKNIGSVTVTDSNGFAKGKNLKVYVEHTDFESETVSTTIPYELNGLYYQESNNSMVKYSLEDGLIFYGNDENTVSEYPQEHIVNTATHQNYYVDITKLQFSTKSTNWGKALGGDYSSIVTFTSEVVAG